MIVVDQAELDKKKFKLFILASHPIQYQAPLFKEISKHPYIDLTVLFCSDFGLKSYFDKGFGKALKWDIPLLEGYKYKFLPNINCCPDISAFFGLLNPGVISYITKEKCDAIWIHGWNSFTNWLALFIAFLRGVPVILRGESNLLHETSFWKEAAKNFIYKTIFKKISCFLAIGKYNIDFYKHYDVPEEKIFLTPYTVNNNYFISKFTELAPKKNELRNKYHIPTNIPVILFCGKLISVKRPMDLLLAYEKASNLYESALIFAGDGILKNKIEDYVSKNKIKNVYFLGFKNQSELPEIYAMSDLLVLPSVHEPWGLVVNEAMCFGLPIIVSDKVGAGGDLVREGINSFIYPVGGINALSEKISILLSDAKLREQMGEESLKIINRWSYEEDISGILEALNKFVGRN
ncbi:MAG: hypothetical protein A3B68_07950 [Candidatus Melainabacteria bacterium RIFCSPHIGHO2_02_FULL_34_12]|nr:MAG: hypothetical protein A3B68_07950 [Candidatus Melainabacteria bacterium RIFCSPHIGHO2_02_FULL_34_12]